MTPPVLVRMTWPHNSSWRMTFSVTDEATGAPLTTGTVGFLMKDATGTTVPNSTASGTHVADGVWLVTLPALTLTIDGVYHATLNVAGGGGATGQFDWYVRAVEVAPSMLGG